MLFPRIIFDILLLVLKIFQIDKGGNLVYD